MVTPLAKLLTTLKPNRPWVRAGLALVLAAELIAWWSLRTTLWQKTGLGWQFWTLHVALAAAAVLTPVLIFIALKKFARMRFQFSMKTMLTLVLAVGACLGSALAFLEKTRKQRHAVAALTVRRAFIDYERSGQVGLGALVGREYLEDAAALSDQGTLNGSDLALVEELPGLKSLMFIRSGIVDADLAHFQCLQRLESFVLLYATAVTGEGLRQLNALPALRRLDLTGSSLTDAGLAGLEGFDRLEVLRLAFTPIGDQGLKHLRGMTRLRELGLERTLASDAGLSHLADLQNLEELRLDQTGITDDGLAQLANLQNLEVLALYGTGITDRGLAHLMALRKLRVLHLDGCAVTESGVAELEKALGNCVITR